MGKPPITVVLVDDHEMVRESLVEVLSVDPGIRVVGTAATGAGGVEIAIAQRPDIVVMDFVLPDMDGAAAIRRLKGELPDVKVITVSGARVPGAYYAVAAAGSNAWVQKTMAVRVLGRAIHSVFAGEPVPDDELDGLPSLDDIVVYYQPVHDLDTGSIAGFEALVRWAHPQGGLVPPAGFLPQAELVGLVADLDRRVGETAARQLRAWQDRFPTRPERWVSVNLSGTDLMRPGLPDWVAGAVGAAGIEPSTLMLEVTETVLVEDSNRTMLHLNQLKEIGVRLALDDFGSGFASLSYLRRFPFDMIKIDQKFTAELPFSSRAMLMAEAIQQMTQTIGVRGIAEGIEREDQAEALLKLGWEYGQGYLFSKPVTAMECESLLAVQRNAA